MADWPARYVGGAAAVFDERRRVAVTLPRPISGFTVRRLDDALAGKAPDAVVTVEPLSWLV